MSGGDVHSVKGVYSHPFFNSETFDFDVALLLLNSTITIDGITKQIIKLPYFSQPVFEGTPVVVSGWGN